MSLVFLKSVFTRFGQIGAVWPSSRFLARAMAPKSCGPGSIVVEIGPGTGALTRAVVDELDPQAKLFLVERAPEFIPILKRRFPQAVVLHADARNLRCILARHGVESVNAVVSGLPFSVFSDELCRKILGDIRGLLTADGEFILFQYIHSRHLLPTGRRFYRTLLRDFAPISTTRVFLNLPPANAYRLSPATRGLLQGQPANID